MHLCYMKPMQRMEADVGQVLPPPGLQNQLLQEQLTELHRRRQHTFLSYYTDAICNVCICLSDQWLCSIISDLCNGLQLSKGAHEQPYQNSP